MAFLLLLLIVFAVVGWHFMFALLGGVLIIGAAGIVIAIASIIMFCVAVLACLFFSGVIGLTVGGIFAIWTLIAIILAPILFPIVFPLFIIFVALAIRQRKTNRRNIK